MAPTQATNLKAPAPSPGPAAMNASQEEADAAELRKLLLSKKTTNAQVAAAIASTGGFACELVLTKSEAYVALARRFAEV